MFGYYVICSQMVGLTIIKGSGGSCLFELHGWVGENHIKFSFNARFYFQLCLMDGVNMCDTVELIHYFIYIKSAQT